MSNGPAKKVRFVKSAVYFEDYPKGSLPEVAVIGRSNSGKSSIVNALAKTTIARTSKTPGKTVLLNFFNFGDDFMLVDLPGYGYAKRSKSQIADWGEMIETYLKTRQSLLCLYLIMDVDRKWTEEEQMLLEWAEFFQKKLVVVVNKIDKADQSQKHHKKKEMNSIAGLQNVLLASAKKKLGISEIFEDIMSVVKSKKAGLV